MSTAREFATFLNALVNNRIYDPVMVWGAPGIGKSSTVIQIAKQHNLELIDLRISQITPADLRGLPAPNLQEGTFEYLPPSFLPRPGAPAGILFLDEITQAPPAVQAITQQLILDRRVGNYKLPDSWFVWAAGNRQQDKTSVYAMPTALANRFHHFDVVADFDTWKLDYAIEHLDPAIISFLSLRPELLHKMNVDSVAWPSPRSWAMANRLYQADISISHAVGPATSAEFNTFLKVYQTLPDLDAIAKGQGDKIDWPKEESIQYAVTVGLQMKCIKATKAEIVNVIKWLGSKGKPEYSLRALNELIEMGPERIPHLGHMLQSINKDPDLLAFIKQVNSLKRQAEA